ncbi:hypothetical protein mRhiFer1_009047 [Rhinolophus ferrumequinum]|uniref:Retroviral envelope protein GP41-like domain-containing protein n=1 Tax=Rhinolophus ferrumequinum TaxID=59479 RepID=A0A7J7SY20_RHIFE|nr:endogenous retrovirus group K member 9 Env polyprotein [Rhinolophus ferrumequinum]KAF6293143.1 hypothetical protein mRhiFer1_009047 [Rhinolophus ferrumequinum]
MLTLLLLLGTLVLSGSANKTYWAYVPDPPLLHPVSWESPEIQVYVNDTDALGLPALPGAKDNGTVFDYTGLGSGTPMCLSRNNATYGCVRLTTGTLCGKDQCVTIWRPAAAIQIAGRPSGTSPSDFPTCQTEYRKSDKTIYWKTCKENTTQQYSITGSSRYIVDWSHGINSLYGNPPDSSKGLAMGLWYSSSGFPQTKWWKIGAAMGEVKLLNQTGTDTYVSACVAFPFALLIGNVSVAFNSDNRTYNVSCLDCLLSACVSNVTEKHSVVLLHQPPFVMIPVKHSGPWFDDKGLQVLEEINKALQKSKRAVGLIIAGITTLITLIAATSVAAVALTQEVQTASYVNSLSHNVSETFMTQESIDKKLEQKVNALYDMVMYLGEEVQGLKLRNTLRCHATYQDICLINTTYNESQISWEKVKKHLRGLWLQNNDTMELLQLHKEIMAFTSTTPLDFNPAQVAQDILTTSNKPSLRGD